MKIERLWLWLLAIKPIVDLTWDMHFISIEGKSINLLSIFGFLVFWLTFYLYFSQRKRKRIFNEKVIWIFFFINLLSSASTITNQRAIMSVLDLLIKLFDAYFIYFIFGNYLNDDLSKLRIIKVIWQSTLFVSFISIVVYFMGGYNVSVTAGIQRFAGLYNDSGGPSYNAVMALIFGTFYIYFRRQLRLPIFFSYKVLYSLTIFVSLFLLQITSTKSAILMFLLFLFMWFGIYRKKIYYVLPLIIIGSYWYYQSNIQFQARMSNEIKFISQGEFTWENARSVGTGRVASWQNIFETYQRDYDLFEKIFGTYRTYGAHNQYLAFLMQIGMFGLLTFLWMLTRFLTRLIKFYRKTRRPDIFMALTLLVIFTIYAITGAPFYYTTLLWYLMILLSLLNTSTSITISNKNYSRLVNKRGQFKF